MNKNFLFLILSFLCLNAYAQDANEALYKEMVNFYQEKLVDSDVTAVKNEYLTDQVQNNPLKPVEEKTENLTGSRRIRALKRVKDAKTEIARLKRLKEEALAKERAEQERKVKEAKVQHLLKALGYEDLAEEMETEVFVDAPL